MNLYKLHANPKELDFHDEAHEKVPVVFWDKYENNPDELKKREDAISKYAKYSYEYAVFALKGSFSKGEDSISQYAGYSYCYATIALKGRFPKGEDVIAKDAYYSYVYARDVLNLSDEEAKAWGNGKF